MDAKDIRKKVLADARRQREQEFSFQLGLFWGVVIVVAILAFF